MSNDMTPYQITEELYVKSMAYAQKRRNSLVIGVCLVVPLIVYAMKSFDRQVLASVLLVYVILGFYFMVLMPMINRINYRRTYRNNQLLHKTQHFELSDTEVLFRSANGESRYTLAELKQIKIFPELVMFYPSTTIFHVIPKNALSEDQLRGLTQQPQKEN